MDALWEFVVGRRKQLAIDSYLHVSAVVQCVLIATLLGVVIGGSGNGEQMAANKVPGVRAALVWNTATAQLAREHNDANVVSIGARQHSVDEATELVLEFLRTDFSGDERHVRRIGLIRDYERDRHRPAGGQPTGPQSHP